MLTVRKIPVLVEYLLSRGHMVREPLPHSYVSPVVQRPIFSTVRTAWKYPGERTRESHGIDQIQSAVVDIDCGHRCPSFSDVRLLPGSSRSICHQGRVSTGAVFRAIDSPPPSYILVDRLGPDIRIFVCRYFIIKISGWEVSCI